MVICEDFAASNVHPVPGHCQLQLVVPVLVAKVVAASGGCSQRHIQQSELQGWAGMATSFLPPPEKQYPEPGPLMENQPTEQSSLPIAHPSEHNGPGTREANEPWEKDTRRHPVLALPLPRLLPSWSVVSHSPSRYVSLPAPHILWVWDFWMGIQRTCRAETAQLLCSERRGLVEHYGL